jgi:putative Holliday junction resolvase
MKVLAIDWGWAKYGLAVSDDLGLTAQGLGTFVRGSETKMLDAIAEQVRVLGVDAIVVGLPRNMDGSDGHSAEAARAFGKALEDRFGLPVHLWDERLTTLAERCSSALASVAARRGLVDQVAATLIRRFLIDNRLRPPTAVTDGDDPVVWPAVIRSTALILTTGIDVSASTPPAGVWGPPSRRSCTKPRQSDIYLILHEAVIRHRFLGLHVRVLLAPIRRI